MQSPPRRFQDVNDTEDEYQPSPSPAPRAKSAGKIRKIHIFESACERCQKGKRDCEVDELGAACLGCKSHKYGCGHTGKKKLATMWVVRPAPVKDLVEEESEESEEVVERKGRKRLANSPVQTTKGKGKGKVKVEKPKPRPTEKKGKAKRQDGDEKDEDAMAVDDNASDEGEPKQKRPRLIQGEKSDQKCGKFFLLFFFSDFKYMEQEKWIAVLEAQVSAFDMVAAESTRTSQRLDWMEGDVYRFTGALESFLGRIRIDDTFRLVPDRRQITPALAAGPFHI